MAAVNAMLVWKMGRLSYKILIPLPFFVASLYGFINYVTNFEPNKCEMTYMYEYPEYIKIPLKYDVAKLFPRYSLYLYGEGKYAEELRNGKIKGIPVLFIPGNAGSYRQVRSLGSVAMRMAYSLQSSFHFNYFTVDFKGEISGLYGGILNEQTAFIHECIQHIQSLYAVETKLILVGHSMGGVISRALFALPDFDASSVSVIFTLASPHKEPVVSLDYLLVSFYQKIYESWKEDKNSIREIPVVSVGGGDRDILVRSELTSLPSYNNSINIHVISSSIPGAWVSADHLAIVWCKQLVMVIVRAIFDLIDVNTKKVTSDVALMQEILNYHFLKKNKRHHFPKFSYIPSMVFSSAGEWIHQTEVAWRFSRSKVISTVYLLLPLVEEENILIVATGLVKDDWVFACTPKTIRNETSVCLEGENLSNQGEIIPAKSKSTRRMINVKASSIIKSGHSHILVYLAPVNAQIDLLGERYKPNERWHYIKMPSLLQRLTTFSSFNILNVPLTDNAVFYNLTLPNIGGVWEACTITLENRICRAGTVVGQGIIKLHVPWSKEDQFYHIRTTPGGQTVLPVKLHVPKPPGANSAIQLHLIMDPECNSVLFVNFPVVTVASQFIKFHGLHIPGYAVALLFTVLSGQLYSIGSTGTCPGTVSILAKFPSFISLVIFPTLLYYGIWMTGFGPSFLPIPDDIHLSEKGFNSVILLRSVLYVVSCGLITALCLVGETTITLLSSVWIWIRHRTILNATSQPLTTASKDKVQIYSLSLVLCCFLAATAVVFAGALALVLGYFIYFFRLLITCAKNKAEEERRGASPATNKWHFHFTLTLLWMWGVLSVIPGILAWTKSLHDSLHLIYDPYNIPCILLVIASALLWQQSVPSSNRFYYRTASHMVHIIAVSTVLFGLQSVFRILYFICVVFIVVSVQQLAALSVGLYPNKLD